MKKVRIDSESEFVSINDVNPDKPVFVKKDGKLVGMLVEQNGAWIIKSGRNSGINGYYAYFGDCLKSGKRLGYDFYVEEE